MPGAGFRWSGENSGLRLPNSPQVCLGAREVLGPTMAGGGMYCGCLTSASSWCGQASAWRPVWKWLQQSQMSHLCTSLSRRKEPLTSPDQQKPRPHWDPTGRATSPPGSHPGWEEASRCWA